MNYNYGSHIRWNLGWNTPNEAGTFVACWLPIVWGWLSYTQNRWGKLIGWVLEGVLACALCLTYSRGALMAAIIGGLAFLCAQPQARFNFIGKSRLWASIGFRILILLLLLHFTDFSHRLDPGFLATDRSVWNRAELWKGALSLLQGSPLVGWGWGQSGAAYMNWVQPLDRGLGYKSMVNSYLTIATEGGLILFGGLMWLSLTLLLLGWSTSRYRSTLPTVERSESHSVVAACFSILIIFGVSNFISNLWIQPGLWGLPALAVAGLAYASQHLMGNAFVPRLSNACRLSGITSLCLVGMIVFSGALLSSQGVPRRLGPGIVKLPASVQPSLTTYYLVADPTVFGPTYGQEMRRLQPALPKGTDVVVIESARFPANSNLSPTSWLILSGEACSISLVRGPSPAHLGYLHPTGPPPLNLATVPAWVILPAYDDHTVKSAWLSFCKERKIPFVETPRSGTDIRREWPAILVSALNSQ